LGYILNVLLYIFCGNYFFFFIQRSNDGTLENNLDHLHAVRPSKSGKKEIKEGGDSNSGGEVKESNNVEKKKKEIHIRKNSVMVGGKNGENNKPNSGDNSDNNINSSSSSSNDNNNNNNTNNTDSNGGNPGDEKKVVKKKRHIRVLSRVSEDFDNTKMLDLKLEKLNHMLDGERNELEEILNEDEKNLKKKRITKLEEKAESIKRHKNKRKEVEEENNLAVQNGTTLEDIKEDENISQVKKVSPENDLAVKNDSTLENTKEDENVSQVKKVSPENNLTVNNDSTSENIKEDENISQMKNVSAENNLTVNNDSTLENIKEDENVSEMKKVSPNVENGKSQEASVEKIDEM
jgi:hypothetical protein